MAWPTTYRECFLAAEGYRSGGQWRDAAVEYLKAFDRAESDEWRELCLLEAFVMQDYAIAHLRRLLNDRR